MGLEKTKPHILHILGTLGMGGAQCMVLRLVTSAELQGYRHSIVCIIAKQGEFLEYCTTHDIPVYECLLRWPQSTVLPSYRINRWLRNHLYFTFPRRMGALLKDVDASLVHTHVTARVALQAKAALRQARLPWIWTLRGLYRSRGEDVSDWARTVGLVNRSNAAITGVSQATLDEVTREAAIVPGKAYVIPNAIDAGKYDASVPRDPAWRAQFGIPQEAIVFGAAGRLIDVKRHDVFIAAAAELTKRGHSAYFVIAGEGPLRATLEQQIKACGLGSRFYLVGYQSDMRRFLREIDVMVLPSDSEGFPNVLIEACAMRLPCIATAVGGVPEILNNGSGVLIPPGSVEALVQAMEAMLDPQARQTYAARTAEVVERFSLSRICGMYAALYEELLSRQ